MAAPSAEISVSPSAMLTLGSCVQSAAGSVPPKPSQICLHCCMPTALHCLCLHRFPQPRHWLPAGVWAGLRPCHSPGCSQGDHCRAHITLPVSTLWGCRRPGGRSPSSPLLVSCVSLAVWLSGPLCHSMSPGPTHCHVSHAMPLACLCVCLSLCV